MRKQIVAGNWKMNKIFPDGMNLINEIIEKGNNLNDVQLIVAPPFIFLSDSAKMLKNTFQVFSEFLYSDNVDDPS